MGFLGLPDITVGSGGVTVTGGGIRIEDPTKPGTDLVNIKGNDLANGVVNIATGGIFGVGGDGQVGAGVVTRGATEAIGQVTGANAARAATNRADQLLAQQAAEAEQLRQNELERLRIADLTASNKAGASQRRAYTVAARNAGVSAFNNLTRDFLGL